MAFKDFDPLPFLIPPMISTGVNYIVIVARMSGASELPGEGYTFLLFVVVCCSFVFFFLCFT
jgi:hypothetical protein